jgi:hypothetical protein
MIKKNQKSNNDQSISVSPENIDTCSTNLKEYTINIWGQI